MKKNSFKCHFCRVCDGRGCVGELPGMGGFDKNVNFKLNCVSWLKYTAPENIEIPPTRLAPMTGGIENAGYKSERDFYHDIIDFAVKKEVKLCIGDGYPDEKIQYGIEALQNHKHIQDKTNPAVFIKPYPNAKIFERIDWAHSVAHIFGIDIDSYNILTMRNLVHLEKKTVTQLQEIRNYCKRPFAIKGVFTDSDIELVKQLKPEIIFISNHGGRVETRIGSTADFLAQHGKTLAKYCDALWVDGGIRTERDKRVAASFGVKEVIIGRPFITELCKQLL